MNLNEYFQHLLWILLSWAMREWSEYYYESQF
jgi:hypothetical protein